MMYRIAAVVLLLAAVARADVPQETAQQLYDRITPSLVAVQYTWDSELARREMVGAGVVVGDDGVVMTCLSLFDMRIPDAHLTEFKIILPRHDQDPVEVDALLLGRDERTNLAFLRPVETQDWPALRFEERPIEVGQPVLSVGLLPKSSGYRSYLTQASVSAVLRGETPRVLVNGGLAVMGSPVFDVQGRAIGFVNAQSDQSVFLNDARSGQAQTFSPRYFVPAADFLVSLEDSRVSDEPLKLPWIGLPQISGLRKDVAEFFDLANQPAVEVGDVIPNAPADRAGLRRGHVIVQMNGQPLERGDDISDLPGILRRQILRMNVGDVVTFSVLTEPGQPLQEISVELEEQPKRSHMASRFYAEDLGFTAREIVFLDTYARRLPADQPGAIVAMVRPQSSAASAALRQGDLIHEINGQSFGDLDGFRELYEELRENRPREAVVLVVIREGATEVIRIEPPQ